MATNEPPERGTGLSTLVQDLDTGWSTEDTTVGITRQQHHEFHEQRKVLRLLPGASVNFSNYHAFQAQCRAYQRLAARTSEGTDPVPVSDERVAECKRQTKTSLNVKQTQQDLYDDFRAYPVREKDRAKPWPSYEMYEKLLIATNRMIPVIGTRTDGCPDFDRGPSLCLDHSSLDGPVNEFLI